VAGQTGLDMIPDLAASYVPPAQFSPPRRQERQEVVANVQRRAENDGGTAGDLAIADRR